MNNEHETRPGEPGSRTPEEASSPERHQPTPRIWVGSLSDYNHGELYGTWIEADQEPDALRQDVDAMLAGSPLMATTGDPAEEWGIFDHDDFGPFRVGESEDLALVSRIARGIAEHGLAFAAWAALCSGDESQLATFEDAFLGHWPSLVNYVETQLDAAGILERLAEGLPDAYQPYAHVDAGAIARDMELSGEVHVEPADGDGVWLFNSNL